MHFKTRDELKNQIRDENMRLCPIKAYNQQGNNQLNKHCKFGSSRVAISSGYNQHLHSFYFSIFKSTTYEHYEQSGNIIISLFSF